MKRGILLCVLCLLVGIPALAQIQISGLTPKNARSAGMGGAFRVFSTGYETFFGNPAALADRGSLTIADSSVWSYIRASDISGLVNEIIPFAIPQTTREAVLDDIIRRNGFGAGASAGLGWAGNGVGLGITMVSDAFAIGDSYDTAVLDVKNQVNGIFGLAWPLDLGLFKFKFGFDIRAFYRLDSLRAWPFADIATSLFTWDGFWNQVGAQRVRGGYGLTVDTGAILELGPLAIGIAVRDYGYNFSMEDTTLSAIIDSGSPPMSGEIDYALVPVYIAGMALRFKPVPVVTTAFYLEAVNPVNSIPLIFSDFGNALDYIHVGSEFKLFDFLSLRAGYNHGFLSLGAGLDFAIIEIDAAMFMEPATGIAESESRTGFSVQAALRF